MKKKTFLVFILFLTWLNYLLSYEYVKTMMDTADASKVSNTIVLLVFPIMWNYGAAIIKIISSIVLLIITLIYQTNEYVDIRKICYLSDDLLIWKIVSILFYIAMIMSAISGIMVLMPMVFIHRIINSLILNIVSWA